MPPPATVLASVTELPPPSVEWPDHSAVNPAQLQPPMSRRGRRQASHQLAELAAELAVRRTPAALPIPQGPWLELEK